MPMCSAEEEHRRVRILVPVNTSEFGEPALETAACTARLMQAEVHLTAVVPPEQEHGTPQSAETWYASHQGETWGVPAPQQTLIETRTQAIEASRQKALDVLNQAAQRFEHLPVTVRVLSGGSVAEAVVNYARQIGVDLIVMPTHGRRPLAQALLGSVASEVVHSGVAPVLLVKPIPN
jgi:nucleotide-binding universal stress UspA family protein